MRLGLLHSQREFRVRWPDAAALRDVLPLTGEAPGCRAAEAYRATRDRRSFYIRARWRTKAALHHHAKLPHTVRFLECVQSLIDRPLDVTRARPIG